MNRWMAALLLVGACGQVSRDVVKLPEPRSVDRVTLNEALAGRRSVREFAPAALAIDQLGQLLWAAQGITHDGTKRTAPSAGATYPLELYLATADGLFHYLPAHHEMARVGARDVRPDIRRAALGQDALNAPAVFAFAAVPARTAARYGDRAARYVQIEVGHAAQNLLLEAAALGLAAVPIGAFADGDLHRALALPADRVALYLVAVGHPKAGSR